MVPSVRIALTTCIALVVISIEARKTQRSGPTPAPPDRCHTAGFSFAAMFVFLILSACAAAPAPASRAALPVQRNVSAPAPDPCAAPNTGQTHGRDIVSVSSPLLRPSDKGCPDYARGLPSTLGGWTWPAPRRQESEAQSPGANAHRNDILNERMWLRAHVRRATDIRVPH